MTTAERTRADTHGLGCSPLAGGLCVLPATVVCLVVPTATRSRAEKLPPGAILGSALARLVRARHRHTPPMPVRRHSSEPAPQPARPCRTARRPS
jgi:hypothetical protein